MRPVLYVEVMRVRGDPHAGLDERVAGDLAARAWTQDWTIDPVATWLALREYKTNLTWRGMWILWRVRWPLLLFSAWGQYMDAVRLSTGAVS
jgi:hypothetical protein